MSNIFRMGGALGITFQFSEVVWDVSVAALLVHVWVAAS